MVEYDNTLLWKGGVLRFGWFLRLRGFDEIVSSSFLFASREGWILLERFERFLDYFPS